MRSTAQCKCCWWTCPVSVCARKYRACHPAYPVAVRSGVVCRCDLHHCACMYINTYRSGLCDCAIVCMSAATSIESTARNLASQKQHTMDTNHCHHHQWALRMNFSSYRSVVDELLWVSQFCVDFISFRRKEKKKQKKNRSWLFLVWCDLLFYGVALQNHLDCPWTWFKPRKPKVIYRSNRP